MADRHLYNAALTCGPCTILRGSFRMLSLIYFFPFDCHAPHRGAQHENVDGV